MPEQDSEPDSLRLGQAVAEWLGIETVLEDITPILVGAGCYRRRDEYIAASLRQTSRKRDGDAAVSREG